MSWSVHAEHVDQLQVLQKLLGDHLAQLVEPLGNTATALLPF